MRTVRIAPGEHYHLYNRGSGKQILFHDRADYFRFLFLLLYCQSSLKFQNIHRLVKEFRHTLTCSSEQSEVAKKRDVELVAFCLMPNHFHLIVKEVHEGGIAQYMQRVLNAYTKYFNTRYEKSGHLFQGPYQAVHIEDDRQLLYLSAYIHRNPREHERGKEISYAWSSYQDFAKGNRWGSLLVPDIITGQFRKLREYEEFVESSTAKLLEEEMVDVLHSVLNMLNR